MNCFHKEFSFLYSGWLPYTREVIILPHFFHITIFFNVCSFTWWGGTRQAQQGISSWYKARGWSQRRRAPAVAPAEIEILLGPEKIREGTRNLTACEDVHLSLGYSFYVVVWWVGWLLSHQEADLRKRMIYDRGAAEKNYFDPYSLKHLVSIQCSDCHVQEESIKDCLWNKG